VLLSAGNEQAVVLSSVTHQSAAVTDEDDVDVTAIRFQNVLVQ